jgi:hypothetical protein
MHPARSGSRPAGRATPVRSHVSAVCEFACRASTDPRCPIPTILDFSAYGKAATRGTGVSLDSRLVCGGIMTTGPTRLCKRCQCEFPLEEVICPACGRDQRISRQRKVRVGFIERLLPTRRQRVLVLVAAGLVAGSLIPLLLSQVSLLLAPPTGEDVAVNAGTFTLAHVADPLFGFIEDHLTTIAFSSIGAGIGAFLAVRSMEREKRRKADRRRSRRVSGSGGRRRADPGGVD